MVIPSWEGVLHESEGADVLNRVGSQNREMRRNPGADPQYVRMKGFTLELGPVET